MSLNVKSSVEVNTQNAQASINNLTNALNKFNEQGNRTSEALNKIANNTNKFIDKAAHLSQAVAGIWGGLGKVKEWSNEFIKTADAITVSDARKVYQVHESVYMIEFLTLQHAPYKSL